MLMKQNIILIVTLIGGLFLAASCAREKTTEELLRPVGSEIVFSAATGFDNGEGTRAVYSGKDQANHWVETIASRMERIDWENGDRVAITYAAGSSTTSAEYAVTNVSAPSASQGYETSYADVQATGSQLVWGAGNEHVFYAMYPTASGNTHPNPYASLEGNVVSGKILPDQDLGAEFNPQGIPHAKYLPDMKYAYMAAYADGSCINGSGVTIPFSPAVTAFNFIFKASAPVTVTQFRLLSDASVGTDLTGDFSFAITGPKLRNSKVVGAVWGEVTKQNTGKAITVAFGNGGKSLAKDEYLDFTVFTLPIAQKGLTAEFTIQDGAVTYTKTIELKDQNGWHEFVAAKKHIVTNDKLAGEEVTWVFEVSESLSYGYKGATKQYSVSSYRQFGNDPANRYPADWEVVGYSVDGGEFGPECPDFLTVAPAAETDPLEQVFDATMAPNPRIRTTSSETSLGLKPSKGTEDEPYDLSTKGGTAARKTANCYIVDAPGWYCIPMTYGNGEYAFTGGGSDTYFLANLVDHKGANIDNAWVSNRSNFQVEAVEMTWQDSEALLTKLQFHDFTRAEKKEGFIKFYVSPATINPGNAVIQVIDENKDVAWSWHIWVTDKGSSNVTVRGKSFMKVNLGWCDKYKYKNVARSVVVKLRQVETGNEAEVTLSQSGHAEIQFYATAPHYQWGRKDPFVPPKGIGQTGNKVCYDATAVIDDAFEVINGTATLADGILNPKKMYTPATQTGAVDWLATPHSNLWNSTQVGIPSPSPSAVENTKSPTTHGKTAYDPCPPGYTVPNARDFRYFHSASALTAYCPQSAYDPAPTWSNGFTIKKNTTVTTGTNDAKTSADNYWPAMGQHAFNNTATSITGNESNNFGTQGYYYTSVPYNTANGKNALIVQLNNNFPGTASYQGIFMIGSAKSSARSIRCVPE